MREIDREISKAVRSLRQTLHQTQEEFAARMKTSVKTITRYETVRPPRGAALAKLALIARDEGREELAQMFESRAYEQNQNLATPNIRETTVDTLNSLYINLGDRWLIEEIRKFIGHTRGGHGIRHPLVIKGDKTTLDRDVQLSIWEKHLMRERLRAGQEPDIAIRIFAREYAEDAGVTEEEAFTYTRIKFPELWAETFLRGKSQPKSLHSAGGDGQRENDR